MPDATLQTQRAPQVEPAIIASLHGEGRGLETVDRDDAIQLMHEHGAVLFRGFKVEASDFVQFSARFCSQFLEHGAPEFRPRRSADKTVAQAVIGNDSVSMHAEMNYSPMRPDVLWMHCTQPATRGGDTLLADSRQVLKNLPDATRKLFETRRVRYRHVLKSEIWKYNTKLTDRDQAVLLLNCVPNVVAMIADDDAIQMDFETDAIRPTGRSGELGFLNSVENVCEYADRVQTSVSFADGEPISAAVLADIGKAALAAATPIKWQPADVVIIDNSRLLHGRTSFEGDARVLDVRFGMLAQVAS
jgi:hypothetical protein